MKCITCKRFIFKSYGTIVFIAKDENDNPYEIKKPLCKKCSDDMDAGYSRMESDLNDESI